MFRTARIKRLIKKLNEYVKHNEYGKQLKTIKRLGVIQAPEAVEALATVLNHASSRVRLEAAKHMGHDKRAVSSLLSLLRIHYRRTEIMYAKNEKTACEYFTIGHTRGHATKGS